MKQIIKKIKPTKREVRTLESNLKFVLDRLNKNLKDAQAVVGGSIAKGTWLKSDHDVDIFVKFDHIKFKDADISKLLENKLKLTFPKYRAIGGSRTYYEITRNQYKFELIPILDIKDYTQAKNVTDISLLHVKYIKSKITSSLKDEVRLAKYYMKVNNLYGAESYINGFSGYVLELLILHYKTFNNLIKHASNWHYKQFVDIENHYKSEEEILMTLSYSKTFSPLIIIDPVHPTRNVAAAINFDRYSKFIFLAQNFNKDQFKESKFNLKDLKKDAKNMNADLFVINLKTKTENVDITGTQLTKLLNKIAVSIRTHGFTLLKYGYDWNKKDKALFYFILQKEILPNTRKHFGPPIFEKAHCKQFIKKYKNKVEMEDSRLFVYIPQKIKTANDFFKAIRKNFQKTNEIQSLK